VRCETLPFPSSVHPPQSAHVGSFDRGHFQARSSFDVESLFSQIIGNKLKGKVVPSASVLSQTKHGGCLPWGIRGRKGPILFQSRFSLVRKIGVILGRPRPGRAMEELGRNSKSIFPVSGRSRVFLGFGHTSEGLITSSSQRVLCRYDSKKSDTLTFPVMLCPSFLLVDP